MSKEDIIKLALIWTSIGDSEEINRLKELQDRLNQDLEASALIIKYKDAKMKLENKMNEMVFLSANWKKII